MTSITKEQAQNRFVIIPSVLQDALFSEQNTQIISEIGEQNHIPDEKMEKISSLVGWVLLGFLHPEDLSEAIIAETQLPPQLTKDVANALATKIFTPIKSEIANAYAPVPQSVPEPEAKNLDTITSPSSNPLTPQPKPILSPVSSQDFDIGPALKSASIPNVNIPPTAPKASRLSDIGWSRSQTAAPVIKLDITPASKSNLRLTPAPLQQPRSAAPSQPSAAPAANHALGEFERLNAMKKAPAPAGGIAPAGLSTEPAPFILHEDTSFSAASKNADFKISQPQANADMHLGSIKPPQPTVKPAFLEFGDAQQTKKPPAPATTSGTIHYTQFQSSLSEAPTQNSGPRQVSQIVAPAPSAAAVPIPRPPQPPSASPTPRPPLPPTPPQKNSAPAQQEKVIVKDFL